MEHINFNEGAVAINSFFENTNIRLNDEYKNNLLRFLPKLLNYEEEEVKITPKIIIGHNLQGIFDMIPGKYMLPIKKGHIDGEDLKKIMKALAGFCQNGWYIFINIGKEEVSYGIFRAFNGITGLGILDSLSFTKESDISYLKEIEAEAILIEPISKNELFFKNLKDEQLVIDFRFTKETQDTFNGTFEDFAGDIAKNIGNMAEKEDVIKTFIKYFKNISDKIHGTICVVIKSEVESPLEILSSGTWLEEPIDFKKSIQEVIGSKDPLTLEKHYALTGILLEMLNTDGVTVIDSKGCVRAFNVFVKSNPDGENIVGGARTRAANSIIKAEEDNILGIYFQSQDGDKKYTKKVGGESE